MVYLYTWVVSEADPEGTAPPKTLLCHGEENKDLEVGQFEV